LPRSGVVAISVRAAASVILNGDRLYIHGVGCSREIQISTSPLASTLGSRIGHSRSICTTNPVAHLYAHGSLGIVLSIQSQIISVVESSDQVGTNVPLDRLGSPVDGVGSEGPDGVSYIMVDGTIVGGGVPLSEEVALHGGILGSKPLPIDLIQIVRLQNETADSSCSSRGPQLNGNLSEHDVLRATDCRRAGFGVNHELGTEGAIVRNGGSISVGPVRTLSLREVGGEGCSQSRVRGTCLVQRIAVCECLSTCQLESREEHSRSGVGGTHFRSKADFAVGFACVFVWSAEQSRGEG
jgi:hypothetical protein